jgi:ATP-dependent RNA helicase DHX8/PRP22
LLVLHRLRSVFHALAELENHLGIAEKTLSEFIIELSKGKSSSKEFRLALRENGADMPDSLVETLWAVIQRMLPGSKGGGGGKGGGSNGTAGGKLEPRPDAAFAGLALPDTRDRIKQMEEEMLAEARAKAEAEAAEERRRSHDRASTRDWRSNGRDADDGR